jgi:hypothetical protein
MTIVSCSRSSRYPSKGTEVLEFELVEQARATGGLRDVREVFAVSERVDERGLAHVGTADDRHLWALVLQLRLAGGRGHELHSKRR